MKAIIVDDEPQAIALLKSYLDHFAAVELAGTFRNGLKAIEFLGKTPVDLVFLDIQMPHLSGISLSKMIAPPAKIIFTTAYSEYAVESYDVEALDYLLKPISLERFTKAMTKVLENKKQPETPEQKALLIKSGAKIYRVHPDEILYLEKAGNYMTYHLTGQKILARETVAEALAALPPGFVQTHKSFIVNTEKIQSIERNELTINQTRIAIGARYKENLLRMWR